MLNFENLQLYSNTVNFIQFNGLAGLVMKNVVFSQHQIDIGNAAMEIQAMKDVSEKDQKLKYVVKKIAHYS